MTLRLATDEDVAALAALVEASVRHFGPARYSAAQIESSLRHLFGVDTQMIADGTYFVVTTRRDGADLLAGAGGWSPRRTAFGGDQAADVRDASLRDPTADPAVMRAYFVHPDWARRGVGGQLLAASEAAARAAGFARFELVATLTGLAFYEAHGYQRREPIPIRLPDGVILEALRMCKP